MHIGSIQFRMLGLLVVGTICSLVACSGSSSAASTVAPPVSAAAAPVISAPAAVAIGSAHLVATVSNPKTGVTYAWTIDGGTLEGSTTGSSVSFTATQAGTLTLTCTARVDAQAQSASVQVQVQANPPGVPQIQVSANVAPGASGVPASVAQPEGGTTYHWTVAGGTLISGGDTPAITFNAGAGGTLTLNCTATNAVGSQTSLAQVQILASAPAVPVLAAPSQVAAQSTQNLASVQSQPGCTYTWSLSGGTITTGQGTPNVAFSAGAGASMVLGCVVTNTSSVSTSAEQTIAVVASLQVPGYYGSCLNGDDIANIVVGWNTVNDVCNRVTSYRLRATHTGRIKAVRPFFIWSAVKPGYALGDGGNIQIQIQSDDGTANHYPSGVVLASLVYDHPVPVPIPATGNNYYPLLTFPAPASLVAGQLFHVVFTNVAPDPQANFVSLDCIWMYAAYRQEQPTVPNLDMAILEKDTSGRWVKFARGRGTSYTPCIELDYEDGASQGQGYLGAFGDPTPSFVNPKPISGSQGVRETFTVSGNSRVATSVSLRVRWVSGTSPLTIRVERSDGAVVGEGDVGNVPVSPGQNGSSWVKVVFRSPVTLSAGQGYRLVLSAPSDSLYRTHALYKGNSAGYKPTTYFGDGHAEFNDGSGWKGWDAWGVAGRTDHDLQFFFETE